MQPTPRRYQDEHDLVRMCALLEAERAAQNGSYYLHTGDLKGWLDYPPLGSAWWEHIYLYEYIALARSLTAPIPDFHIPVRLQVRACCD